MKRLMSALLMCVMAIVFCVPAFAVDTATTEQTEPVVFKSNTLPDWFPEDAPAPDPHGEIVTVYWYVDENGNTVTYNPAERKTATGNAGTATIYWVDAHMVTWGILPMLVELWSLLGLYLLTGGRFSFSEILNSMETVVVLSTM